jgi:hypothetical protein
MELWEEFANLERHNLGEHVPDAPKTSCETPHSNRRAIDREPARDSAMTMLGLALLGAGLVGVCLIAGYFGLWVWR